MEHHQDKKEDMQEYIERITTPIFSKFLKETPSNSMTTPQNHFSILWRPNNYRRQMEVKEKDNSTSTRIKGAITKLHMEINQNPHTKIISIKGFQENITLQYAKKTLTAIYSQPIINNCKLIYLVEGSNEEEVNEWILKKKEEISQRIDKALFSFARQFNVILPLKKPKWARYEDYIRGEDYIDKIPREVIIHSNAFKKVYGKGIEFIKHDNEEPTESIRTYIENTALNKQKPTILQRLDELQAGQDKILKDFLDSLKIQTEANRELAINIKSHTEVIRQMAKGFKKFNRLLEQRRLNKWIK